LHTSDAISQRKSVRPSAPIACPGEVERGHAEVDRRGALPSALRSPASALSAARFSTSDVGLCSMKATCRQVLAPSAPVLS
jgi:hypothetical protein